MKKTLVITLILMFALSAITLAGTGKINPGNVKTTDVDTFLITNENAGYLYNELKADFGTQSVLYVVKNVLGAQIQKAPGQHQTLKNAYNAWLAKLESCPACAEVFTATLNNFNLATNQSLAISADGTLQIVNFRARPYHGTSGYSTWNTHQEGIGRELFTYANSPSNYINISHTNYAIGGGFTVKTQYKAFAMGWASPVVLDLNGDGKLDASGGNWKPHGGFVEGAKVVMFDINGDGFEDLVEWVSANDGLLLMPGETANLDAKSLFGNTQGYKDGFEKLASFDVNKDGLLTGEELKGMNVWVDINGDGKANAKEIKSVQSLGISEIAVTHTDFVSSFVQNGQRKYSWDWWPTYMDIQKVASQK